LELWRRANGLVEGAVAPPQTVYDLGAEWYATRLERGWQRAGLAQVGATFARHGLTGLFWSLAG
jgi:hypothetical protein